MRYLGVQTHPLELNSGLEEARPLGYDSSSQAKDGEIDSQIEAIWDGYEQESSPLTEGAGDASKIPWDSWKNYEKVTQNGQTYAKVGDRLYSEHAVNRMQPSGKRFTVGDAIVQAGGVSGRSVAPQFVEDVISSVKPVFQPATGNYIYSSGTVKIVTNEYGHVVTIMTVG
ncbi:hypothetical protein SDC9_119380 [bioreactor metagenome]|uniref:Uncharacterized protein n=1 Tax=bioreactor metagenome TaxID=1076179 RepID=A0A645C9F4_9ZZZZ